MTKKKLDKQTPEQEALGKKLLQQYRDWSYGSADNNSGDTRNSFRSA